MDERKTTEKYKYSPSWMDRVKRAEGGGMPDSDGDIDTNQNSQMNQAMNQAGIGSNLANENLKQYNEPMKKPKHLGDYDPGTVD